MEQETIPEGRLLGIGISSPGPIDLIKGEVLSPPKLPKWRGVPVVQMVRTYWDVPVLIEKDSNAMLLGEWRYGRARQVKHALYLMVDAGIGSSLLIDGKVYRGGANFAGEIGYGHYPSRRTDDACGRMLLGAVSLIEEARERLKRGEKKVCCLIKT